jgi:hypothetical protein
MYRGVKDNLFVPVLPVGALTDELTATTVGSDPSSIGATGDPVDARLLPESDANADAVTSTYGSLQRTRGNASQAIGMLQAYAPDLSPALRGEMYALAGYAELMLAELYCSGVPLSTLDFQQDFTYKPSSTTDEVYRHAITLFDSALAISSDSASVVALASVLKGRALLDLGQYAQASQAVAAVPDTFRYQQITTVNETGLDGFAGFSVANQEGENGLPFSSANDPRVAVTMVGTNMFGVPIFTPNKYPGTDTVLIASGIEARLIKAEAELEANSDDPSWLVTLNTLRTTCTDSMTCPVPAPAGTGGVDGLPPLSDPGRVDGTDSARVTLLFRERAYWLFLTAHRQGDLRRLVSRYGRPQESVYPTGPYFGGQGLYGADVTFPIPESESPNPLFHGCLNRKA